MMSRICKYLTEIEIEFLGTSASYLSSRGLSPYLDCTLHKVPDCRCTRSLILYIQCYSKEQSCNIYSTDSRLPVSCLLDALAPRQTGMNSMHGMSDKQEDRR